MIYLLLIDRYMCKKETLKISPNCLVEVVYYLKLVFHLPYDKGVTPSKALLHLSLILCIVA